MISSKSTNIVLGKSLYEVVENIVMKFKRMLEIWKEEKCKLLMKKLIV
jgi:hypothetical protein